MNLPTMVTLALVLAYPMLYAAYLSLHKVLLAIQSMVLVPSPFFNEPGTAQIPRFYICIDWQRAGYCC